MDGSEWRGSKVDEEDSEEIRQSIHLMADGTIKIETAANVVVNCAEAQVNASVSTTVTTPLVHMESEAVTISGTLAVTGIVTGAAGSSFGAIVSDTHTHTSAVAGSPSSPPIA